MDNMISPPTNIKDKIHTIRGLQVMLDSDLAELYEVETRVLNQAVKRNIDRFPEDFMFQLNKNEFENLMFQNGISRSKGNLISQNVISRSEENLVSQEEILNPDWGGRRKPPYVFTEQGVASLSGILKSKKAVEVNILIMRAFISMRRFIQSNIPIFQRFDNVEKKLLEHDKRFEEVFKAIEDKDIKPDKGIFFDGQVFDAYILISDIIRGADKSIIL